ncbi:MAG: hypothetical protein CMK60_09830 [Proteobacteria bacterium]|nr:hypothetical protein [Pseudomonadota bacterium]MBP11419.1 hypothetical protein [Acidiferrobacteraceae bacterium]MDP6393253.1 hypothetical protein [Arenicellales bacterium]MDP7218757.1 hypothetical protein [Arenicellales bacterium]
MITQHLLFIAVGHNWLLPLPIAGEAQVMRYLLFGWINRVTSSKNGFFDEVADFTAETSAAMVDSLGQFPDNTLSWAFPLGDEELS